MTSVYQFNHKFFQRGQTWQELLSSWSQERGRFLAQVNKAPILAQLAQELNNCPRGARVVVWFDQWRTDARKALPALGKTLSVFPKVEVRFFDSQVFFPELYSVLGRPIPQIIFLNQNHAMYQSWGPRPKIIENAFAEMQDVNSHGKTLWLQDFSDDTFNQALDEELSAVALKWTQNLCLPV